MIPQLDNVNGLLQIFHLFCWVAFKMFVLKTFSSDYLHYADLRIGYVFEPFGSTLMLGNQYGSLRMRE